MKKTIRLSAFLALAVSLSIIESFFPILDGTIPGIKLGLANVCIIYILYKYSFKDALLITILRVFLTGLLRTGLFNSIFLFSISGAVISLILMYIFKKLKKLSIIGISIIGSIGHLIGQILCFILLMQNFSFIYYMPILLLISIPSGIITGKLADMLIKKI